MGLPHPLSGLECTHTQMHADAHTQTLRGRKQTKRLLHASSFIPFKGRVSEDVSVPLSRLQSVLSCPSISSSLPLTFLLLLGCWKTLLASLPTSLQALYFTDSSRLFPCHSRSLSVYQFSVADQAFLRDPSFSSFQTGLVSPAVRLASVRCPSLPPASRICH